MALLRNEPALRVEDYDKDVAPSMGKLFRTLTPFFSSLVDTINGRLGYGDNVQAVTKSYDLTNVQVPINFQWPYSDSVPAELAVTKALIGATPTILLAAWSFDISARTISITKLLEAPGMTIPAIGARYQFTVRATV